MMKERKNNSWIHLVMIVIIAFMPLRVLTANADFSASTSSAAVHQVELHNVGHEDCNMDASCFTDCQVSTTHCSSVSLVIPSSIHGVMPSASNEPLIADTKNMQSISNRNLFRPPRKFA